MKSRLGLSLAASTILVSAAFLALPATSQTAAPTTPPAATPAPAQAPTPSTNAAPAQNAQQDAQRPRFSAEDRIAFFEARLAAVRAGLRLTTEQEQMWPAVESATRDMIRTMTELRQRTQSAEAPANPFERMRRAGEVSTARGAALTKMADAILPLWNSLSDDQKRRFQMFSRGMMGERPFVQQGGRDGRMSGMMERGRDGERGERMMRRERDDRDSRMMRSDRDDERGDRMMRRGREDDRDYRRSYRDRDDERGSRRGDDRRDERSGRMMRRDRDDDSHRYMYRGRDENRYEGCGRDWRSDRY
jgi:zinc resistance-associated protein